MDFKSQLGDAIKFVSREICPPAKGEKPGG